MRVVGLILAGGRSRRFGSEKAVASLGSAPMIAHVAAAFDLDRAQLAVNAPDGSASAAWAEAQGLARLPDAIGDFDGPLAGVRQGLLWAAVQDADALVVAPCDTPRLPTGWVRRLSDALRDSPAAYAVSPEGAHPLCSAWTVDLLPRLEAVLVQGHPSVRGLLDTWNAAKVSFPDGRAFANVNTPAEAAALTRASTAAWPPFG